MSEKVNENKTEQEKGDVKPQNKHYNIKKQALGSNGKR